MRLSDHQCHPIRSSDGQLGPHEIETYLHELNDSWTLDSIHPVIFREFCFKDYYETINFVNKVAEIIHAQDHHPEIKISYNRCIIEFITHSINNLSINDFICAAKINQISL